MSAEALDLAQQRPGETALRPLTALLTALRPGAQAPGGADPALEAVRFRPALTMAPPTGEISAVLPGRDGRWLVEIGFLGLYGPSSPLPPSLTEWLLAQNDHGRTRDFLDIFNHRAAALFCRAAEKYRSAAGGGPGGSVAIASRISRLLGSKPGQDDRLLGFAGLLGGSGGSAEAMERLVGGWFGAPCTVQQCSPRWTALGDDERCGLGAANCGLGSDLVVGARVLSAATSFSMVIGPVSWRHAVDWEPGGRRLAELAELLRRSESAGLDARVELLIDTSDQPQPPLGHSPLGRGGRLAGDPPALDRRMVLDTAG